MLESEILTYSIFVLGGLICILLLWIANLHMRLSRFMKGSKGLSLEGILSQLVEECGTNKSFAQTLAQHIKHLEHRAQKNVGNIGMVRFNAFDDTGGNQSFASAFVSDEGNGVVFSGIHGRDRMTVYAKPVEKFTSSYDLSSEEKNAIEKAQGRNE